MNITSDQLIASYPAMRIRNFIRRHRLQYVTASTVEERLNLIPSKATAFLNEMVRLGFMKPSPQSCDDVPLYEVTRYGQALANASAAKLITRETANRLLEEFMSRVHVLNAANEYAYKVESVVLFGSMLSEEKDRLGDVDIAVELAPVTSDFKELERLYRHRRRIASSNGKRLATAFEWAAWPTLEVFLFLKACSNGLSLHELRDLIEISPVQHRVLYGDPIRLKRMFSNKDRFEDPGLRFLKMIFQKPQTQ